MLLNTVIIMIREVLEIALLTSVLLAYGTKFNYSNRWVLSAIGLGLIGTVFYGANIGAISEWFDYVGQEITNTLLHLSIYILFIFWLNKVLFNRTKFTSITVFMCLMVMALIIKEGAEVYVYLHGLLTTTGDVSPVITGVFIGTGIGLSVGVFFYYLLIQLPTFIALPLGYVIVMLQAASMVSQGVQLLIQADWLPQTNAMWDSSNWLNESSIAGQIMYALMGYEATPTSIQLYAYLAAIGSVIAITTYQFYSREK